jgi:oligopeptide transport system substrate-binding protein
MSHISMRTDKAPYSDVRVRRRMSMAIDRKGIIDRIYEGVGVAESRRCRPRSATGRFPWISSARGSPTTSTIPPAAKKLLAEAGRAQRLPGHGGVHHLRLHRSSWTCCQLFLKYLKDVGIDAKLVTKEYGAYISTTFYGKFDTLAYGPRPASRSRTITSIGQYYPAS